MGDKYFEFLDYFIGFTIDTKTYFEIFIWPFVPDISSSSRNYIFEKLLSFKKLSIKWTQTDNS